MLNRIVPTPAQLRVSRGGLAVASIANTSVSGRSKRTTLSQTRDSSST
ncbi:MAG: hypothetical protein Q8M37_05610 [Nevskia sp.]|nr:hypothetical protein [Nevskia sp.]